MLSLMLLSSDVTADGSSSPGAFGFLWMAEVEELEVDLRARRLVGGRWRLAAWRTSQISFQSHHIVDEGD